MVMVGERRRSPSVVIAAITSAPATVSRPVTVGVVGFIVTVTAFWLFWPAGVLLGLSIGCVTVLWIGPAMHRAEVAQPAEGVLALQGPLDLPEEFRDLRRRLDDDWVDFGRAALLVTAAQWASVAALHRELRITTAYAQHLMSLLEREGFVGPSRGTRPRVVRLPRENGPELDRLLQQ